MNVKTASLMNSFSTSIFSELSSYKQKLMADGKDIIDLSIGSPDLPPPQFLREVIARNSLDGGQYGYTLQGIKPFQEAVCQYYKEKYDTELNPNTEVLQLMGSQDGLVHLPMVFANRGDIILAPDPGYTAYQAGINLCGAEYYPMPLEKQNGYLPDLKQIPQEIADKAKMMILNFPGNPVPALATTEFYEEVVTFAKKHQIIVLHDFAYSELVFDGRCAISFLSVEGAMDVGVEFNSLSKSYNMAGTRVAYVVGNSNIIEGLARLKTNLDYGVFMPVQKAAVAALTTGAEFLKENAKVYETRRDILVNGLNEIGWKVDAPPATMFIWTEVPSGFTSIDFCYLLMERAGVVVTPGSAFGKKGEGYVRIALVQSEVRLREVVVRLKNSELFKA